MNIGERVGAILKADEETVYLLGFGVYDGFKDTPEDSDWWGAGLPNPRITLDDGRVIWGYQCWWGPEDKILSTIGDRKVVEAEITTLGE